MQATNFDILIERWPLLAELGKHAEQNVYRDPSSSLVKIRLFTEKMCDAIFSLERLNGGGINSQVDKIRELERQGIIQKEFIKIFHRIRKLGNQAAHDNYGNTPEAMAMLRNAHYLANWFMKVYDNEDFQIRKFKEPKNIDKAAVDEILRLREQIKNLEIRNKEFQKQLEEIEIEPTVEPIEEIRKERKNKSKKFLQNANLSEKETRVMFIDEQLREAGWEVDTETLTWGKGVRPEKNKNKAISEVPIKKEKGKSEVADYALFVGLKLVGVIEGKKYSKSIPGDLSQVKGYSERIKESDEYIILDNNSKYKAPFIYATNGRPYLKQLEEQSGIWFWDARTPNKHAFALESWHSPEDLVQKLIVDEQKATNELKEEHYPSFASRQYQIDAVKAIETGLEENKRRMLVAMATGTGKTRLALSLMYRLIKTKRVRRILFLVDRKSLGEQTADALKDTKIENISFSDIYDVKEIGDISPSQETKIHIATVQGMVKRLFYKDDIAEIPSIGTYDFIIVDEAHRGYIEDREMSEEELYYQSEQDYVSQYRRVIDYFDATVVGLTATPALHTTEIFGAPIFTYSYSQAVIDGYLVDHEPPIKFETQLSKYGIKFEANKDVDIWNNDKKCIDKAYIVDELNFDVEQFNKKVITENFNKVILNELVNYINPNAEQKTLIFAATDAHADMIVRLLKEAYKEDGVEVDDDAIKKITGYIRHQEREIKKFKNEKYPSIVVTVDLLTTGINVPAISNLVFMRRVRSRILYDQMLGRATRLCPSIGKDSFRIFDAVYLYDYLKDITDMKPVVSNPIQSIQDILEKTLNSEDEDEFSYFQSELIAKLQRKKQRISDFDKIEICTLNKFADIDEWIQSIKNMTKEQLEQQKEQIERIANWTTRENTVYISTHEDKLVSVSKGYGEGNTKPSDYLDEFNKFIRENMNLIPALQIVVTRPKDLTYADLKEIQLRLKEKRFDEKSLREAWRQSKKEVIAADIISFIRQAALGTELVDHEVRIKRAMNKIYGMEEWTPKQLQWLNRIESQLLQAPVLAPTAKQYFDETEIWKRHGGYKFMTKQIGENIDEIVQIVNEQLYA